MRAILFNNFRNVFLVIVVIGLANACIEPYDKAFNLKASPLIVDGFITDQAEADTIFIKTSKATTTLSYSEPMLGCKAVIIPNGGTPVALLDFGLGRYVTPVGFRGQVGKSYQLQFTTPDGRKYESSNETMAGVPEIQKIYDKFDTKAYSNDKGTIFYPANILYIDAQDPAVERNFYLWRYIEWEREEICATCDKGTYNKATESCVPSRFTNAPTYDYQCEGSCWSIVYSNSVNVFSDINSNGKTITGRVIGKIPFYSINGCLLEVQQASLSNEAFEFFKLLDLQGQSTGSLTDAPPAAIVGNVRNVNLSTEPVVGYFGASSIKKIRYWLDRKDAIGKPSSLLGHEPNLEPGIFTPFAKCFPGRTKTPFKPFGWVN